MITLLSNILSICKLAHIKSTVYCPKKGTLTMICDVARYTHYYPFLGQMGTVIH